MDREWFVQKQYGPLSVQELKRLAACGEITADCLIRYGGDGRWIQASEFPGLQLWGPAPRQEKVEDPPPFYVAPASQPVDRLPAEADAPADDARPSASEAGLVDEQVMAAWRGLEQQGEGEAPHANIKEPERPYAARRESWSIPLIAMFKRKTIRVRGPIAPYKQTPDEAAQHLLELQDIGATPRKRPRDPSQAKPTDKPTGRPRPWWRLARWRWARKRSSE